MGIWKNLPRKRQIGPLKAAATGNGTVVIEVPADVIGSGTVLIQESDLSRVPYRVKLLSGKKKDEFLRGHFKKKEELGL